MLGFIDDVMRMLFYGIVVIVVVGLLIVGVRFSVVVWWNSGEPIFWDMWTSPEMKDVSNADYWEQAIVGTLVAVLIGATAAVTVVCFCGCWQAIGCSLRGNSVAAAAPPVVALSQPPIQVMIAQPQSTPDDFYGAQTV